MIGYGFDLLRNPDIFYDSLGLNKKETPQKTSDSAASQPYQIGYGITDGGYTGTNISFGNDMGMSKNANSAQTKSTNQATSKPAATKTTSTTSQNKQTKKNTFDDNLFLEGFNSARDRDWRQEQRSRMQKLGIGMPFESTVQKIPVQQPASDKLTAEDEKAFLEGFNQYREDDKAEQAKLEKARAAYADMQNQTPIGMMRRTTNGAGIDNPLISGTLAGSTIKNGDLTPAGEQAFLEGFNQYRENVEQPQVKEQEKPKNNKILDGASTALAAASLIPGLDTFTNLASIPVDLMRGDYISAGLDLLGAIPFVGEIADVAKTARTADRIIDGARAADKTIDVVKTADKAVDTLQAVDDVTDGARAIDDAVDVQKVTDSGGLIKNKRDILLSKTTNQKVKEAINQIYRPKAKIGDGGLGDAIRHELITGELVGGKSHMQKGKDRLRSLENILKKENLSPLEESVVKDLIDDLKRALEGD